jgi:hypothetical protein
MKWIAIVPAMLTLWLGCTLWAKATLPKVDHSQPPWTGPLPSEPRVERHYHVWAPTFTGNMDGTWFIPFGPVLAAQIKRPDVIGLEVLLAWPLLRRVSRERAEYVATHPETWVTS